MTLPGAPRTPLGSRSDRKGRPGGRSLHSQITGLAPPSRHSGLGRGSDIQQPAKLTWHNRHIKAAQLWLAEPASLFFSTLPSPRLISGYSAAL
ncbi:hypothetical protein NN561_006117 [Cricetulus griseus]